MYRFVTAVSVLLLALPALAQFDSGSNGTDGAFNPQADIQIDLALAASLCDCGMDGQFNDPCESFCIGPVPGRGVYDASEWAVVFNYTTIDIPAGVTVTFHNHPKGAPVVWLASENVIIAGQVRLDGADGSEAEDSSYAIPGPGGFSGGIRRLGGSHGFGPGGGSTWFQQGISRGGGGGYGTAGSTGASIGSVVYGTASIVPLIGGSGGSFARNITIPNSGGAGGGAILIASSAYISLPDSTGGIFAMGGDASGFLGGSGSGGGIRLITNHIFGSGLLRATGGTVVHAGGKGRIRVEATTYDLDDFGDPQFPIITVLGDVFPDSETPSLRATIVNNTSVPTDPEATVRSADVVFTAEGTVTIEIEAQKVPIGSIVQVRIVRAFGTSQVLNSTPLVGSLELSTATVENVTFINGASEVQLSVVVE